MKNQLCTYVRPSRTRCRAVALLGSPFCYYHTRQSRRAKVLEAQPAIIPPFDPWLHLGPFPTLQEIQAALCKLFRATADGRIDPRRSAVLLRQLQGAHRRSRNPIPCTLTPHHPAAQPRLLPASPPK